jgi:hypothetical protein
MEALFEHVVQCRAYSFSVRKRKALTITEGELIMIGAETYRIIGEPMGDALGLVLTCEASYTGG